MVALSGFVVAPALLPAAAFAQVIISCPVAFRIGNIVKCGNTGKVTIRPDGNLKNTFGCAFITNAPQPGVCTVETGGVSVSKNVKVTFAKKSAVIQLGGDTFVLDKLRMSYTGSPGSAQKLTLTPNQVKSGGVTIKIGGRATLNANSSIGVYTGNSVINAN